MSLKNRLFPKKGPTKQQMMKMQDALYLLAEAMSEDPMPALEVIYVYKGRRWQVNAKELIPAQEDQDEDL